jgi:hypothetical protein
MKKEKSIYEKLLIAKIEEEEAKENRIKIEEEIFKLLDESGNLKTEGQTTIARDGFKITVKRPQNYSIDEDAYRDIARDIPEQYHIHKWKLEIDPKKFKFISQLPDEMGKNYFKKISDCVEMKMGKISVNVERQSNEKEL